ncbi:DNA polymerase III subunit delta [Spiroplasma litorale]|uniref:DNA polymerase III subunit delta n=1 Tax=Spiroplasma litorale TaxID=216942 RepID=A0A0K1W1C2_9MOLU|nr:hypothetical protein [Spiroplasma litorale]AKX34124.1 DNA polymerase III subunit delta [Spiroplasma litorale]
MYLVYSDDNYLIKMQTKKIINKISDNSNNEVLFFSLIDNKTIDIYEECQTMSLFNDKKIIVISDCWFLTENKVKLNSSFNIDLIKKILSIKNPKISIIFTLNNSTYSKRLKICKDFELNCKVLNVKQPTLIEKKEILIKKFIDNNINYDLEAIDYFLDILPNDMGVFTNELSKFTTLNQDFNKDIVTSIVKKYLNFDVFNMLDSLLDNDFQSFIKKFKLFQEFNNDIFGFITLVANSLITIRNIVFYKMNGLKDNEIIDKLSLNPYRFKILSSKKNNKLDIINDKINMICYLDKSLKNGTIDNKIIPELIFVKLFINN